MSRLALLVLIAAAPALAEGTTPRKKAADYPVREKLETLEIGAEYLVHSFSGHNQTFVTSDYLVVEVALYPAGGERPLVASGQFTLRINGKKSALLPQAPGMAAASLKYPDWENRPSLTAAAGPVIIGRPAPVERFPGDPRPGQTRLPAPPRAPEPENPSGMERESPVRAEELVVECALPEGIAKGPVSGYLYFPHKGKVSSIRSLELIYTGTAGNTTLKLI